MTGLIEELAKAARPFEPSSVGPEAAQEQSADGSTSSLLPSFDELEIGLDEFNNARRAPKCIVENHTWADVCSIAAPGGTGKSTLSLYVAVCIAIGRPVFDCRVVTPGWTLIVSAEDKREHLVARLRSVIQAMDLSKDEQDAARRAVRIWDVTGQDRKLVGVADGVLKPSLLADQIVERYAENPPIAVEFDPLVSFGADEERVNTNEQAIITAARRIVNGLDCCVRLIHHTGQAAARAKVLDQYATRGGTALSDGSRMVFVFQTVEPGEEVPPTLRLETKGSIIKFARPKMTYCPPNLPVIFIQRIGFEFRHALLPPPLSPERIQQALDQQVLRLLSSQIRQECRHTKNTFEPVAKLAGITRVEVRAALARLEASGQVVEEMLPPEQRKGGRKTFLCPIDLAKPGSEVRVELVELPRPGTSPPTTSPP